MTVDVVIPVHGNWELTQQCLDTLSREPPVGQVIVVDDASPDDTPAQLARRSDVVPVVLEHNRGFAGACNAGAARSSADAILFLNNDTIVPDGAIARLTEKLEADPAIGAIGPKLLYADGSIQTAGSMLNAPDEPTHMYVHLDGSLPEANRARDDLFLTGAAMLVRRDLFVSLDGFDEAYHNGIEDCDFGMRVWTRGYRCRYEPSVTVTHLEGASRGKRHDDDANRALFAARWGEAVRDVPHLVWQDPPAVGLRWSGRDGLDILVRNRLLALLKRFGGARRMLVRNAAESVALRVLTHFDGRALIDVAYRQPRGDVRVLAPRRLEELEVETVRDRARYWVPSAKVRWALGERGIPLESISTLRLGTHAEPRSTPPRPDEVVFLLASRERAKSAAVAQVARVLGGVSPRIVTYENANEEDVAAVRTAGLVVALDEDPWGLFVTEALAGGAVVVAETTAAGVEFIPSAAFVGVETADSFADVLADVRKHFDDYAPRGARAVREVARRFPEIYGGTRLRELARSAAHGVPDAAVVAVTPELAASLRR